MTESATVHVWAKSLPSRLHPEHDEDLAWVATNGRALAVVDGMGSARRRVAGHDVGGEHAATRIGALLAAHLDGLPATLAVPAARDLITAAVDEAGRRVFEELNAAGRLPAAEIPPGKTAEDVMVAAVLTVAVICENGRRAVIGQNGDTRAYLLSAGELLLLTEDQDAVQADQDSGVLPPDSGAAIQATLDTFDGHDLGRLDPVARRYFANRNLVFGQIGDSATPPAPVLSVIQLRPDDLLLLCSDGVYGNLTTAEIAGALTLLDPAAALVDRADARSAERSLPDPADLSRPYNYRAHQDDITAVVLKVAWVE